MPLSSAVDPEEIMQEASSAPLDIVIVGGGISGLQTLKECLTLGLSVRVLEGEAVPGGKWNGHGIYDCVRIQQHKDDFYLPGSPFPESMLSFAARDDVLSCTSRYIEKYGLRPHVECRCFVESAEWDEAAHVWTTKSSTGDVWRSRYIALAIGTLGPPNTPRQVTEALAGFRGDVVHSHEYYHPTPHEGQHVVVLGFGASSVEIAQDLAWNGRCASVTLVAPPKQSASGAGQATVRHGQDWCLSRALPDTGSRFNADGSEGEQSELAPRNEVVRAAMQRRHPAYPECMPPKLRPSCRLDGRPLWPGEDGRPLGGRVIVSEGFLDAMADGSIVAHPGYITAATADTVTVNEPGEPERTLRADAVIVCTGYVPPHPRAASILTPKPRSAEAMYMSMWLDDVPHAAIVGHVYGFVAVPPIAAAQAKYMARVVSGRATLPPQAEMRAWVDRVEASQAVTQRLADNALFAEVTAAYLGDDAGWSSLTAKKANGTARGGDRGTNGVAGLSTGAAPTLPEAATRDMATSCVDEALSFWPEGGAPVAVLELGAGAGGGALAPLIAARLRDDERRVTTFTGLGLPGGGALYSALHEVSLGGSWPVTDGSIDVLLSNGGLNDLPPSGTIVASLVRVLKPGGHAVLMLREDAAGPWLSLCAQRERPTCSDRRWRLMHKTRPLEPASAHRYRQYVFRAC